MANANANYVGAALHPKDVTPHRHLLSDNAGEQQDNTDTSSSEPNLSATQAGNPESQSDTENKRYWDLKAHHDQTISAEREKSRSLEERLASLEKQNKELQRKTLGDLSKAEIEESYKKYPDVAKLIRAIVAENQEDFKEELSADIVKLREKYELEQKEQAKKKVLAKYPKAVEIYNSTKFKEWVGNKPRGIQELFGEKASPSDIIYGFDLYTKETGDQQAEQDNQLNDSFAVETRGSTTPQTNPNGKVWRESEVAQGCHLDPNHWWEMYGAEVEKAQAEGRFIADLSGKK